MILASFAEVISIGTVLPFLGVLTAPAHFLAHPATQSFIQFTGLTSADRLLLPLTFAVALAALMAGAIRLLLLWASTRLSVAAGADLGISMYRRTLYQPYPIHVSRNSSEVIDSISTKAHLVIYNILVPALTLITAGVMLVAILVAMLAVDLVIALLAFGGFGLIYALIIGSTRRRLLINSQRVAVESTHVIKSLQEGLGGIRDVLLDGSQSVYCKSYSDADRPLRRAQGTNHFIGSSPRLVMEALGIALIAGLAYALSQKLDGSATAIPVLGALALGAQRLLPVLQQAYAAWTSIKGNQASLQDTLALLDQPLPEYADQPAARPLPFERQIALRGVSFRYGPQGPWVLRNLDLSIAKGSRVGFIGTTGSGKSTLFDIVMCLLQPTEGTLSVDGQPITPANLRSWQVHIAHVPQSIFLADSTIEENIAFGVPKEEIHRDRVRQAARQAQVDDIIESFPKRYQTLVGERGVRLSGGQRQRIGIARALYKQADVIIFDEATSALDSETEGAVMQAIEGLSRDLTILIIAHRLTTLKGCSYIVELADTGIKRIGTYQDVMSDLTPPPGKVLAT